MVDGDWLGVGERAAKRLERPNHSRTVGRLKTHVTLVFRRSREAGATLGGSGTVNQPGGLNEGTRSSSRGWVVRDCDDRHSPGNKRLSGHARPMEGHEREHRPG